MIQAYLEGIKGVEAPSRWPQVWHELGRFARLSHSIPVQGFGGQLADAGRGLFSNAHTPTWEAYINYNIASLATNDALIELGVYSARQREEIASLFGSLLTDTFQFGLCHHDLKPSNTIIVPGGEIALLDWGSAMVHIVPHIDLAEILRWQDPQGHNVRSFVEGYGLSWPKFKALLPQVQALQLIRAFDLVRWAIDRRPDRLVECAARVKRLLERTLYSSPWHADLESVQP
jgi:serine/threonine protein kinase